VLADVRNVPDPPSLRRAVERFGARLVVADIAAEDASPRHDPVKLAAAFDAVVGTDGIPTRGPGG
jgi:hypothetical protein